MLYGVKVEDFINKNFFEISQVIFKDYPNIISNYFELYLPIINRKDLQDIVLKELFIFSQTITSNNENISQYEEEIINNIEKKFNNFNSVVKWKAKTNDLKESEKYDKQQDLEYLAKIDFNF